MKANILSPFGNRDGAVRSGKEPTDQNACVVVCLRCIVNPTMWEIDVQLVRSWLDRLEPGSLEAVVAALEVLADHGPALGRPLVDTISGSRHRNMKELRPGSSGSAELRILFAFDPVRHAILLVGGDKSGNWIRWYREHIPIADRLYDEHLRTLGRNK